MAETATNILIGTPDNPVRLSYVWLNEPQPPKPGEGGKAKYQCSILIPKTATALVNRIKAAIEAAKVAGKSKLESMGGVMENALKDGDDKDDPNYAGHWYLSAKSDNKPQVVDRRKSLITDASEIYSGMWAIVSVNFYAYAVKKRGIATGLGNVLKVKNGEPFTARSTAEDDFSNIEIDATTEEDDDFI